MEVRTGYCRIHQQPVLDYDCPECYLIIDEIIQEFSGECPDFNEYSGCRLGGDCKPGKCPEEGVILDENY